MKDEVSSLIRIKTCSIREVYPGMKLGKAIATASGMVLLDQNVILTDTLIQKLLYWKIREISIIQEDCIGVNDFQAERKQFVRDRDQLIAAVSKIFQQLNCSEMLEADQIYALVNEKVMPLLLKSEILFSYLHIINYTGEYLFRHSVNVAFLAGMIGKWLHWSETQIQQLVVAGMLHDIGKMRIPVDILDKPNRLLPEEMDVMKQHPVLGYEILQEVAVLDETIKQGILQHHERFDKSGYPAALPKSDISQIAKVIAVADVYDAMISIRVYRKAMSPIAVMHEIYNQMFVKLDLRICSMFIQYAKQALIGSLVKLSNGLVAKIIYLHSDGFMEPIVQIMTGQYIALEEVPGVQIEEFIC